MALARDLELRPGTSVGGYVVEGRVGEGAAGVLYSATHPTLGKRALIRVMDCERCQGRVLGGLGHPHLVTGYGFGVLDDGRCYLVMEALDGATLAEHLRAGRRLQTAASIEVAAQVALALEALHAAGVVHGHVTPETIFVEEHPGGYVHAKLLPLSAPPPAEAAGDVHALGVILSTCLPGARGRVAAVVERMLVENPADRPTPAEVVEKLLRAARSRRIHETTLKVPRLRAPRAWTWVFLGAAVFAAVAGAAFSAFQ